MKRIYEDLVRSGQLKPVSASGIDQAKRLLKRAAKDIRTAEKLLREDEAAAMDLIYKGIFHAANAFLRLQGYRPGTFRQHAGVLEALRRSLGQKSEILILAYDSLRKKRNKFEYQAIFSMSTRELEDALRNSRKLIFEIRMKIDKDHPQLRLDIHND